MSTGRRPQALPERDAGGNPWQTSRKPRLPVRFPIYASAGECRLTQSCEGTGLFKKVEARLFGEFASLPPHVEHHWNLPVRLKTALQAVEGCCFAVRYYGFCHPTAKATRLRLRLQAGLPVQLGAASAGR